MIEVTQDSIGREVFYQSRSSMGITTIARLTKTMVIMENDWRISRATGRLIGESAWNHTSFNYVTEEHRQLLKRKRLVSKVLTMLEDAKIREWDMAGLESMEQLLTDNQQKTSKPA